MSKIGNQGPRRGSHTHPSNTNQYGGGLRQCTERGLMGKGRPEQRDDGLSTPGRGNSMMQKEKGLGDLGTWKELRDDKMTDKRSM